MLMCTTFAKAITMPLKKTLAARRLAYGLCERAFSTVGQL